MKIKRYESYDLKDLSNLIALMSANVEDAYILANIEYTEKECFNKGFELAKNLFNSGNINFTIEYSYEKEIF